MGAVVGLLHTLQADHYSVRFQYGKQIINKRRGGQQSWPIYSLDICLVE
jgi:hypothetical protein